VALVPGPYHHPRVSRDGKHFAVAVDDRRDAYIAVYDISSAAALRRLTFEGKNQFPVWSGDNQWIAFQSDRDGDLGIFMQRADGSSGKAERLTKPEPGVAHVPESWSPDGRTLLFSAKQKERSYSCG
jgi:Tol biopolymer transport system component